MKIVLALTAVAVVSLSVYADAQFGSRLPSGSYSRTCDNETMIGSVLTAECKDQNGIMIRSRLYVRTCVGDISNEFGELVCEGRRLPQGSYSQSCTACSSEGSSLRCTCRDTMAAPIKTQLDLASCDWGSRITNKDGHLQCD
jgi:hypothetical protein